MSNIRRSLPSRLLSLFLVAAIPALIALVLALPLWFLATSHRGIFNAFAGLLVGGGLVWALTARLRRAMGSRIRRAGRLRRAAKLPPSLESEAGSPLPPLASPSAPLHSSPSHSPPHSPSSQPPGERKESLP